MEVVILNLVFSAMNAVFAYRAYNREDHKYAIFSAFASGFCLCAAFTKFIML